MGKYSDVLLAVPTRGAIEWATAARLQEVRDANPSLPPVLFQPGNLSVALTRNRIVKHFMAGPWRTLLMVDDDVVPPPGVLEVVGKMRGLGFGALAVPHPMPSGLQMVVSIFGDDFRPIDPQDGAHEAPYVATGCIAVDRKALERLGPAPFRMPSDPDAELQSDDFIFCRDLREAGIRYGYLWDDAAGGYCNHHSKVGCGQLLEGQIDLMGLIQRSSGLA